MALQAISSNRINLRRLPTPLLLIAATPAMVRAMGDGELDVALSNISYFYSRDIDESVGKVQSMIEPTLTVTMGLILGWIMVSVLGPIYDTISTIKI